MSVLSNLDSNQLKYAKFIVAACKARQLPGDQGERLADIALETALTESSLRMLANENNPASLQLPHDGVGDNFGSVGLFQQQVGGARYSTADWGATAELMDPAISTRKFLDALLKLDWIPMTNWQAAQAVQSSGFPDGSNYRANDALAIQIRKALWDGSTTPTGPTGIPSGKPVHTVVAGDTLFAIAKAWGVSLQSVEAANPNAGHPPGNFDNIHPGDRIVHP